MTHPIWCTPTPRGLCLINLGAPSVTVMRVPGWCGAPSDHEGPAIQAQPTCEACARKLAEMQEVAR